MEYVIEAVRNKIYIGLKRACQQFSVPHTTATKMLMLSQPNTCRNTHGMKRTKTLKRSFEKRDKRSE